MSGERSEKNKELRTLGANLNSKKIFFRLLQKYSSSEKKALEIGCGGGKSYVHGR